LLGTITVIGAAALLAAFDLPRLLRKGWGREAAVYSAVLALGTLTSVLAINLVQVSSPFDLLLIVYKPLADWLSSWAA